MRRPVLLLALVLIALLAALAATPLLEKPPDLRIHTAAGTFDATRAKERLAIILGDENPHPSDSAASDVVRARLIAQIEQLGLQPIIRDQFACNTLYKQRGVSCARVRNIIVRLGPQTGKALLLNAHYDSTPVGPAAADDGIGVATLLEVGSILKQRPIRRPVILLFNEGEELGLIGARAFMADPLSRDVDALINLEARGVTGPVNMFETSRPNAAPIAAFANAVDRPIANSLSTDVYRLMPNYTDVNSFAERGWLTLNLAPIGNETRYHSPGDTAAALDPATLQHMGDQTLALAEKLALGTPRAESGDRIFMDVASRVLVSMPLFVGAILLAILLLAFAVLALVRGGLARGTILVVGTMFAGSVAAWILLELIGLLRPGMFWRASPSWTLLMVYAVMIACGVGLMTTIGRTLDRTELRPVFWFIFLILGGAVGLFAPGGIVYFLFPPLIVLAGMIAKQRWQPAERVASIVAVAVLYLTWGAMLGLLQELLNVGPMWIFALLGSFLILPVIIEARSLIANAGSGFAIALPALLTATGVVAVLAAPAYSADRQQRFVIQRATEMPSGKSWWSILNDGAPLPRAMPGSWSRGTLPISERQRWLAPAPQDQLSHAPALQVVSQESLGKGRALTFRLAANGNERIELSVPEGTRILSAGVDGFIMPIDQKASGKTSISCGGRSCDGAVVQLTTAQPGPVRLNILGTRPLPANATPLLNARPQLARPQYNRDEAITYTRQTL
ncbi:M28 family peptidase [Sphingomonas flavescens]|uniref:M28 family peptidase n=1 Tax=Sphingomonas flavescens TaxID=3132797 RepID=UPI002804E3DB|nr:M28 family peptidase [Sphingomonas limnosediminicola]